MTTMRTEFVGKLPIVMNDKAFVRNFDIILRNAQASHHIQDGSHVNQTGFSRFMFIEVCLRAARFIYCDDTVTRNASFDINDKTE